MDLNKARDDGAWILWISVASAGPHTHTHTHTRVSQYQKGKTNLDFTEARDSEWQWHQLGHMQVCTLLQTHKHISTPPLCFFTGRCPSCSPTNSIKALKAKVVQPSGIKTKLNIGAQLQTCPIQQNHISTTTPSGHSSFTIHTVTDKPTNKQKPNIFGSHSHVKSLPPNKLRHGDRPLAHSCISKTFWDLTYSFATND